LLDEKLRGAGMPPRPHQLTAAPLAQTSVRFPKPLLKRARIRCATDEISLQRLLICALETELDRRDRAEERHARRTGGAAGVEK
jgi:hypothetical protein